MRSDGGARNPLNCDDLPEGSELDLKRVALHFECLGYIKGAHDMMAYLFTYGGAKNTVYCIPKKGISTDQLRRILIKWIKANPETMNWTARQAMQWALTETFPCRPPKQSAEQSENLPPSPRGSKRSSP